MAEKESRHFPFQNDKSFYYNIIHGFNFLQPPFHNTKTGHKLCSQQQLEDSVLLLYYLRGPLGLSKESETLLLTVHHEIEVVHP